MHWNIVCLFAIVVALNVLSNVHFGFNNIPKTIFSIFNAFDQLLNYNRQNQCSNEHYLYPTPITQTHFTQGA